MRRRSEQCCCSREIKRFGVESNRVTVFVGKRTKSCMFGSECSKGEWQVPRCAVLVCEVLVAVSESDMSPDVFFPCHDKGTQACAVERKLELEERQFRFELITFGAGADRGHDDHDCKVRVHEVPEARKTMSLSRDVGCPIPKDGLLEP